MLPTRKAQPIARNAAWLSSHGNPNSNVLTIPVPCTFPCLVIAMHSGLVFERRGNTHHRNAEPRRSLEVSRRASRVSSCSSTFRPLGKEKLTNRNARVLIPRALSAKMGLCQVFAPAAVGPASSAAAAAARVPLPSSPPPSLPPWSSWLFWSVVLDLASTRVVSSLRSGL